MKRLIAIALVSLFGFAFGCGGAQEAPATAETPDESAAVEEAAPADEAPADEAAGDEAAE